MDFNVDDYRKMCSVDAIIYVERVSAATFDRTAAATAH
jgi:hypothetical protein